MAWEVLGLVMVSRSAEHRTQVQRQPAWREAETEPVQSKVLRVDLRGENNLIEQTRTPQLACAGKAKAQRGYACSWSITWHQKETGNIRIE